MTTYLSPLKSTEQPVTPLWRTSPATYGRGETDVSHSSADWGEEKEWFEDIQ